MEQLTMLTDEKEFEPVSSSPTDDYNKELEQLRKDFHEGAIPEEVYKKAFKDILERKHRASTQGNPNEPQGSSFHELMLHAVADMYGPGGIVVDEAKARSTPCSCTEYKPGKFWCTSPGVVGALTDKQEGLYCNPRQIVERPRIKERLAKWAEAVEYCQGQMPPIDGQTRLEIYLDCMSRQLKKSGVEV